jgi:high-affinity K+ transport system ATPase subunit B
MLDEELIFGGMRMNIPTVDFFGTQVSRLILGDNSMAGLSYIPRQHKSAEMLDYWTAENCVKALFEAERCGINSYMAVADPFILRVIRQYKNEGGKMHIMFQSYPPVDLDVNIVQMKKLNPVVVYHQGTTADIWLEEGKVDFLRERIGRLKKMGLPTGLATHVPEVMFRAEEENWGVDFYMTCLQKENLQR